jgi:hypothetical protein
MIGQRPQRREDEALGELAKIGIACRDMATLPLPASAKVRAWKRASIGSGAAQSPSSCLLKWHGHLVFRL